MQSYSTGNTLIKLKRPELLSPAGSLKAMRMAFAYGADAVYAGLPRLSLRVRNNEFTLENLALGITEAHQLHKQFYVVVNLMPHNSKINTLAQELAPIIALRPDALIVADPGVIFLLRAAFSDMPMHLSVQANSMNWAAVKFWHTQGISRAILSRELGLPEIAEIKQRCPEMELEVFVHGALCMAYSGRCLISNYMNKRDPNQGACTNACRWSYEVKDESAQPPSSLTMLVTNPEQPGEDYLLEEDELGSYLFNSKDLRAVALVEKLTALGVDSLKIEGRTKSPYYVARTAQVYRSAIDDALGGTPFNTQLLTELDGLSNRGYTEGFLRRHQLQSESMQNYTRGDSEGMQQIVGELSLSDDPIFWAVEVKNYFSVGDELLLMTPAGNHRFKLAQLFDQQRLPIRCAPGSGHKVYVPTLTQVIIGDNIAQAMLVRLLGAT